MRHDSCQRRAALAVGALLIVLPAGCTREGYRLEADREAYAIIAERNTDARWSVSDYSIDADPRSRFFDRYDPDRPPMPRDDPASQRYMIGVNGISGWKRWSENGIREELENPAWRDALTDYVEVDGEGAVTLGVDSALTLAYMHSPLHQRQLETLYLSALDVSRERFRLATQFFGGYDFEYANTAFGEVRESQAVLGRPSAGNPALEARRFFATGGQLLVGFANSFVWELTGSDPDFSPTNFSASLVNFALVQPLLRGAGKDVALEQLTLAERNLLGNLRAYSQFRQGFYTQVVVGELGVSGPRRPGPGMSVLVSRGQFGVGGYLGLLEQLQRIRNTEDNLDLQLRTLAQLEAFLEAGLIELVQVDQFRQNIENERARLLLDRNRLQQSLDDYKTGTLGLPPDLPIRLDEGPILKFQFVAREASEIQDDIAILRGRTGALPDNAPLEPVRELLQDVGEVLERMAAHFDRVERDLLAMDAAVAEREREMDAARREAFLREREALRERLAGILEQYEASRRTRSTLEQGLENEPREVTVRGLVVLLGELVRIVQGSTPVQARARLESISVEAIELDPAEAFELAKAHRLDFMNARSALVDSWRSIQVRADALQSDLDITVDGSLRTSGDSGLDFRSANHTLLVGLEFDSAFTRLIERNDYRESLIDYQRNRRSFIQSRDQLHLGLRTLLRDLGQLRAALEIQRRAVMIAIRRVDLTQTDLYAPVRPPPPGQRPAQFGPTAAINLLSALSSLRDTQNSFLGAWLDYYAVRLRLYRELGIMQLDDDGRWVDPGFPGPDSASVLRAPVARGK